MAVARKILKHEMAVRAISQSINGFIPYLFEQLGIESGRNRRRRQGDE